MQRATKASKSKGATVAEIILLILGIVCIAYGILIKGVGSGTMFFCVWLAIGIILILLALGVHFGALAKAPKAAKVVGIVLVAILAVIGIVESVCIAKHFNDKGEQNLDYIIVLGAQVKVEGPSVVLQYRLETAIDYLRANPDTLCIVTGAQGYTEPCSEAQGMKEYLVNRGVDPKRIIMEDQATNTNENIKYSMKLMRSPDCSVGIVTNNFHVFRGLSIAKKQGLENAWGISAPSKVLYLPNNVLREFFGISKDVIRGNI